MRVAVFSTLMLPEALVVESLLEAHGIAATNMGRDLAATCPQFTILFGGIHVLVDEDQADVARDLIGSAEPVPGYKTIQSDGFERNPVRNALLTFATVIIGAPFPFWYRRKKPSAKVQGRPL